jgi:hypothetical protein
MKYYILGTLQATVTLPYAAKYSLYFTYGSSHAGPHKVFFSYLKDMHWTAKIPAFRLTG